MNIDLLMFHILVAAKRIAPFDTGNLSINAIQIFRTPEGFKIVYNASIAPYVGYLEYGTKYSRENVGFIEVDTRAAIATMIRDIYENNYSSVSMNFAVLAERAKANPAINQAFIQSLSRI